MLLLIGYCIARRNWAFVQYCRMVSVTSFGNTSTECHCYERYLITSIFDLDHTNSIRTFDHEFHKEKNGRCKPEFVTVIDHKTE